MRDADIAGLAGAQFNRVARWQLRALGGTDRSIDRRIKRGQLVAVEQGVLAIAPVLRHDQWGRWMGATLTAPGSVLSHASAAAARGTWSAPRDIEVVTRRGSGGPRLHGGVLVHRSRTLDGDVTHLRGIPITSPQRTLLDLAPHVGSRALARLLRESVRLRLTSLEALVDRVGQERGRRGSRRLLHAAARYSGLPLERARSGAEVRALEILRDAAIPMPRLNVRIAGEEADLSWAKHRLIIEIDGGPFHLDVGEDARKQVVWEAAGWTPANLVRRCLRAARAHPRPRGCGERPACPQLRGREGRSVSVSRRGPEAAPGA